MRVGFGTKCSPYSLACYKVHHIKKFDESNYKAFQMLTTSLYRVVKIKRTVLRG